MLFSQYFLLVVTRIPVNTNVVEQGLSGVDMEDNQPEWWEARSRERASERESEH